MTSAKDSKQKLIAAAAIIIIALLAGNAFLLYNGSQKSKTISQQVAQIDEAEKLKTELEKQYYEALAELEEMRGSNEELNSLIDKQKEDLKTQKDKISKLIRSGKAKKSDLAAARQQIQDLAAQRDQYMAEVTQLKDQNQSLTAQTVQLSEDKTLLQDEVSKGRMMNDELVTAKAALVSEKEELETERAVLSKKVSIASVIKVSTITAEGWKIRKSGKPVKKRYAKNIDRLTLCFDATQNNVVEAGSEQFHVRIINPVGETLAIEELGSGVLNSTANNEQIRYTRAKEIDYSNTDSNVCINWEPNIPFQKGTYEVQIYNKGYLAGQGTFTLK